MISQRDILQFFNIVDILSNPEKIKAELAVLQNFQKDLEEKTAALEQKQLVVTNKEATADTIVNKQEEYEQNLAKRTIELDAKQRKLSELEEKLTKAAQDQQIIAELVNRKTKLLDNREVDIQTREDKVLEKEASINKRTETLKRNEEDYVNRIKQLRSAVL